MRKYLLGLVSFWSFFIFLLGNVASTYAQQSPTTKPSTTPAPAAKNWTISDLKKRSNDHLVFNVGYVLWTGQVDGLNITGFNHVYGLSFFYDLPFRSNPHFSVAPGIGINLQRVYFDPRKTDVTLGGSTMQFKPVSASDNYSDVQGLLYNNLEAGLEARYISNPARSENSFKVAVGIKLALTFDAIDYQKNLYDKNGTRTMSGVQEFHDARFMQFPHTIFTLRVGYGVVGVYASYQATELFSSSSQGPKINPINFGLILSGL